LLKTEIVVALVVTTVVVIVVILAVIIMLVNTVLWFTEDSDCAGDCGCTGSDDNGGKYGVVVY
jgi:hypothetical protein